MNFWILYLFHHSTWISRKKLKPLAEGFQRHRDLVDQSRISATSPSSLSWCTPAISPLQMASPSAPPSASFRRSPPSQLSAGLAPSPHCLSHPWSLATCWSPPDCRTNVYPGLHRRRGCSRERRCLPRSCTFSSCLWPLVPYTLECHIWCWRSAPPWRQP